MVLSKKPNQLKPSQSRWMEKIQVAVDSKIDEPTFSVSDLADSLCMSERQMHRRIKAVTGLTPKAYIRLRRLNRAKELLEGGKARTIADLAKQVGYHTPDYFSRLFQQEFGSTPSEFAFAQ